MLAYYSITVSYARELTSAYMRYSQGDGFYTSLSRFMYCTHLSSVPTSVPGYLTFLCCVWLSSMARLCATRDERNNDNVCTPTISAGINRPPPSRPSRIYPECRTHETRLARCMFRSPGALTFGYGCTVHIGVNIEAGGVEVDVIYMTFIISVEHIGYLVPYKDKVQVDNRTTGSQDNVY